MKRKTIVENSSGQKIKTPSTDNDEEYTSREFEDYSRKKGILHERTVPKITKNTLQESLKITYERKVYSMNVQFPK